MEQEIDGSEFAMVESDKFRPSGFSHRLVAQVEQVKRFQAMGLAEAVSLRYNRRDWDF